MNKLALWGTVGILSMSAAGMGGMANAQVVGGLYQQYGQNAVYRYYNGALHQIPSAPMFNAMGLNWQAIQHVPSLPGPVGNPVRLIRQRGQSAVYLIAGGQLHWITSGAAFAANGYRWPSVQLVNYLPLPVGSDVVAPVATAPSVTYTTANWVIPSNASLQFVMSLPDSFTWVSAPDPYRPVGAVWNADGGQTQVAVSLNPTPIADWSSPPGTILHSGGDSGAQAWMWIGSGGRLHGTELVSMGTAQYGWDGVLGDPAQDETLLLNVTLPNAPSNQAIVESMLADWSISNVANGATDSVYGPGLPAWPANPLMNSNAPSMPAWLVQGLSE